MRKFQLILALGVLWAGLPLHAEQAKQPASKAPAAAKRSSVPRAAFDRALLQPAALRARAPETFQVKFSTTRGDFTVKVTRAWAPLGADRFYNLVKHRFYDGASFFRVLPGFVVQFGLSPYPQVSQAWRSAVIPDDRVKQGNRRGFVTFATGGPNTRTTQVFINLADNSRLDSIGFSPFGEVVEGMNVVEMFYQGYGEGAPQGNGPRQDLIESRGNAYLDKAFPKLDSIKTTTLIAPEGAAPARVPGKAPAKAATKKPS